MRIFFLTGIMACLSFLIAGAQPVVKATVDKGEILIGDQFKLTISTNFSAEDFKIDWPVVPDSMQHFEVVSRTALDSVYVNNKLSGIAQTYTLTSFDSGKWVLPSFLVKIKPIKEDTSTVFFTDSLPITVSYAASDTTNQLRDIKPIREADTINTIWYWIGSGLLLVSLVIFLWWFFRYWKKNKGTVPIQTKTSAYEQAIRELENLKTYNLFNTAETKMVHTKLGEILKRYLSARQRSNVMNNTTGDILILLNDQNMGKERLAIAASSLRCSDAVKFAKYFPPASESSDCLNAIKEIINEMHQDSTNNKPLTLKLN